MRPSTLDLGLVGLHADPPAASFTVANACGRDVHLGVREPRAPFHVIDAGARWVPAGHSTQVHIALRTRRPGAWTDALRIEVAGRSGVAGSLRGGVLPLWLPEELPRLGPPRDVVVH